MKTEVVMERSLFGRTISQKSKTGLFSATDLVKAGNVWRASQGLQLFNMTEWLRQKGTKEFVSELESKFGDVKVSGRGRNSHTWVHPLLFIDMALAIDIKLKIEVYQWLYDSLLKYRNESGDSYKKMSGYLWSATSNKSKFKNVIMDSATAIKQACGVDDWQKATSKQLELRDKLHDSISLLADVLNNPHEAIRLGILHVMSKES